VLYNPIAQRDAWVNLDLLGVARSDNVVMINDSNAMKPIAVLTTVFLPGTFISATICRILSENSFANLLVDLWIKCSPDSRTDWRANLRVD
jgi:hypothetical protein